MTMPWLRIAVKRSSACRAADHVIQLSYFAWRVISEMTETPGKSSAGVLAQTRQTDHFVR